MKVHFALLLTLLIQGCAAAETTGVHTYRGFVVLDPEVQTFQRCDAKEPVWLDGDTQTIASMLQRQFALQERPYERTYAALEGTPGPALDCGFCEGYAASFKVSKVAEQRKAIPGDCTGAR